MPRKVTNTAWAVYIDPATLATHLDAAAHQAVIDTLLECASSTSDEYPHISNLPHELVLEIKDHLVAEKPMSLPQSIAYAKKTQMCFKGTCYEVDHLPDAQVRALENHLAQLNHLDVKNPADADEVQDHVFEYLCDRSPQIAYDEGIITADWHAIHGSNIREYEELVGRPGTGSYGVFTSHQDFLLKRYGVQVWPQFEQFEDCSYRAEAYLTLPPELPVQSSTIPYRFMSCSTSGEGGHHIIGHRCDAEKQEDNIVDAPRALDPAQHAIFARAIEALAVEPVGPPQYREMSHIYRRNTHAGGGI
ncbi:hypothetical protein LTR56_013160 [Elasticomyces elasticus]|nr:hypothetical protein LTR56_013160 [Elasticomyces elasticus]KAK3656664.1 hypothetical protein LTR22_009643 [Elasticomyces elasticus]KAK4921536.1 hypothetical protein LTR49_011006 [Elasticomyces elasticus]KAK5760224.1 hypothetical protein LTS12_009608 [Elasticomyces elasticus]